MVTISKQKRSPIRCVPSLCSAHLLETNVAVLLDIHLTRARENRAGPERLQHGPGTPLFLLEKLVLVELSHLLKVVRLNSDAVREKREPRGSSSE